MTPYKAQWRAALAEVARWKGIAEARETELQRLRRILANHVPDMTPSHGRIEVTDLELESVRAAVSPHAGPLLWHGIPVVERGRS